MFSENTDATGLHIPFCYGWKEKGNKFERGEEIPFCDERARAFVGHGAPVEKGLMPNPSVVYYYHSQLEFSYMMLQHHIYSGSSIEKYMPIINESLKFFDEHYQIRKKNRDGEPLDENGKLVIFPSQSVESYKAVTNPVEVVAGLRTCLKTLQSIDAPCITKEDKEYYRSFLRRVPELPFGELEGHCVMRPAESYNGGGPKEAPQYYPLFPYNMFSLLDDEIETFRNTWKYDQTIRHGYVSWHQNGIFMARMGMAEDAFEFHYKKLGDNEKQRRFPTYWGPGYDGIPDHNWGGSGMIGLQEMVMQCFGDQILILPCWDTSVDVDFKLHAPKQTVVEVSLRNGRIQKLSVVPKERETDVIIVPEVK